MTGNSVKATSGINGAGTSTQFGKKILDNAEEFYKDIWMSAAGAPLGFPVSSLLALP